MRPSELNSLKTHCKHGHAFTTENTYIHSNQRHCRTCGRARSEKWRKNNPTTPEENWANNLHRYDRTPEEYDKKFAEQKGLCAICLRPATGKKRLCNDHDHETEENRDLLCWPCNLALGCFKDDPDRIQRAVQYIRRWKAVQHEHNTNNWTVFD